MDEIFKALTDKNRRKILWLLKNSDLSVSEILKDFNIGQATVSTHLAILRKANLVTFDIRGKYRVYKLNKELWFRFVEKLEDFLRLEKQDCGEKNKVIRRMNISY